jgi:ABC-2 type transport system permease protein
MTATEHEPTEPAGAAPPAEPTEPTEPTGVPAAAVPGPRRGALGQATGELWQYRGLVANFARRELKSKYKGSVLGWTWSLLNPLATLGIYALIFGFFLKFAPEPAGNGKANFAISLFTGLVVWNFFFAVVTGSMGALVSVGPLLRKIYFPPWTPVAGSAIGVLVQTGIETCLLLVVYLLWLNVSWTVILVPLLLAFLAAFSVGIGLVFALLNARFRDMAHIVNVLLNLLFYSAPIIYPIKLVRDRYDAHPWARLYEWNPLTQFVEAFRDALYYLRAPSAGRLAYLAVVSAAVLVLGWWFFRRGSSEISEEL